MLIFVMSLFLLFEKKQEKSHSLLIKCMLADWKVFNYAREFHVNKNTLMIAFECRAKSAWSDFPLIHTKSLLVRKIEHHFCLNESARITSISRMLKRNKKKIYLIYLLSIF